MRRCSSSHNAGTPAMPVTLPFFTTLLNWVEQHLAQVDGRLVTQPRVGPDQVVSSLTNPVALFVEAILNASVQQFPQCRHARHARDVTVLHHTPELGRTAPGPG